MKKNDLLIKAGLGEEVLASLNKEKKIKKITNVIASMIEDGKNPEEIARKLINCKEDKYGDF